eukprot:775973-Amphidinium_carterae.1
MHCTTRVLLWILADAATARDEGLRTSSLAILTALLDLLLREVQGIGVRLTLPQGEAGAVQTLNVKLDGGKLRIADFLTGHALTLPALQAWCHELAPESDPTHLALVLSTARPVKDLQWLVQGLCESLARVILAKFMVEDWSSDPFVAGFHAGR